MKPHKHAELIKLWADGAVIQVKGSEDKWFDVSSNDLSWDIDYEYRIKPEPKPDVVIYGVASLASVRFIRPENFHSDNNFKLTFDGETGELKAAEVLK